MEIVDRFTKLENGKVRYSITGEASDNLVVLMHGLTTSKDIYNDMTFDLTSKGFQVLSFDFYGRGESDYVPNVSSENLYVNQSIELIEKFIPAGAKRNINLIGYSAGGSIASMVADKLDNCASLILIASTGVPQLPTSPVLISLLHTFESDGEISSELKNEVEKQMVQELEVLEENETKDLALKVYNDLDIWNEKTIDTVKNHLLSTGGYVGDKSMNSIFESIGKKNIPTFIMSGSNDNWVSSESGKEIHKLIDLINDNPKEIRSCKKLGNVCLHPQVAFRGDVYEGDFRDSSRHGFGKYTWVNGDIYEGEFSYGKRHGFGNYVKVGADSILGEWRNDQFTKQAEQLEAGKSNIRSSASRYLSRSPTNGSQKPQLNVWNQKSLELSRKIANLELAMKRLSKPKTSPRSYDNDELIAASSGTGFFVSKDGHLITNNHVISHCSQVKLKISGQFQDAQVIARDKVNDVALLKGSFKNFKTIPISSSNPELLQDIYAAGFPFGSSVSSSVKVTKGIVSSLSGVADNFSNVQIDAALQPGNSGGPIMDDYGNAVAVAVAKLDLEKIIKAYGVVPENTNFGIKATVVRNLLEANNIQVSKPNTTKLSGSELGQRIT